MTVFWRCGLTAVALVDVASFLVQLAGPQSPVSLILLPVVFLLFQVPYMILAYFTGASGMFRPLFYGSAWLLIPFWTLIVILWNGASAALIANFHARFTRGEGC